MRIAAKVILTEAQRAQLERWANARQVPVRLAQRAQIVLLAAEGKMDIDIANELRIGRRNSARWRKRFMELGLSGIEHDAPRSGRKRSITEPKLARIVHMTTQARPANATHWSTRSMARAAKVSEASVRRIWHAHGLKPHLVKTFKVSNDRHFIEKLQDIVGLYLDPPEHSMVLCCDEKSQIQALDRTQPGLPLKPGRCGTYTHDYKRNGTTTLFAALSMLDGKVIGDCMPRHRHQEFLRFLKRIDVEVPAGLDLHLIVDNYGTHKHPRVKAWLRRHPRCHLHFIPTSSSWLNLVERWFRELTDKRIRRGSFLNVPALIAAIKDYLDNHNQNPQVFVWSAPVERILAKIAKCKEALDSLH